MILFRPAVLHDLPDLERLSHQGDGAGWTRANLAAHLREGGGVVIAEIDGKSAAYLLWRVILGEAEILNFVVGEAQRRKGIGRALMDNWLTQMRAQGIQKIFLDVRADNEAAIALYTAHGFKTMARRRDFYPLDPTRPQVTRDALTMVLGMVLEI